ncbi:Predicted metal-binding protein [Desulfatibacillum alkenivorans DSM 16219]|jgi:predicted metal-binding protein|uniref:Predicted metal-binding protein n=1 Tax=Desulfatibacillum alkenivorans DSM 16219 TaxID=1121393 RepID=A0A1M6QQH3_9BACT|nr:DUF2284 domain-containing protein [Desulfatibacillum alkenivorans]SHK22388.1 Predicted metal-binding protein [Desulfatibacillum alkenivorans DSM 16219]
MHPLSNIVQDRFDHHKEIAREDVPFNPMVRKMCEANRCGSVGKSWTCPPALASVEELLAGLEKFDRFLIIDKVYELESSYDWKGMMAGAKDFQDRIQNLRNAIRESLSLEDFVILGVGACQVCETCSYANGEPCRFPEKALYSVEAYGIDAMKMMKDAGLKYYNGPNTVTYIGGVFFLSQS